MRDFCGLAGVANSSPPRREYLATPFACEIFGLSLSRAVLEVQIGITLQAAFVLAQETHSLIRFQAI